MEHIPIRVYPSGLRAMKGLGSEEQTNSTMKYFKPISWLPGKYFNIGQDCSEEEMHQEIIKLERL